jgi:hypothetical protein
MYVQGIETPSSVYKNDTFGISLTCRAGASKHCGSGAARMPPRSHKNTWTCLSANLVVVLWSGNESKTL